MPLDRPQRDRRGLLDAVAVLWPRPASGLEGETARVEEASSFAPLASLYSSTMEAWSWQSELLASSSLGGK
ncbi:MAG: hypothetical protein MK291_02470 [Planctomycetes bacterium]|nr:hypothetical protein [Planctomycetota bacterium]